ncbi:MAG: hypothetical protein CSA66_01140 [Proteobacteria bacterium]|nr:MAG: hypothetical protein CSA66_01140 [Pseudomonadota bacterium]
MLTAAWLAAGCAAQDEATTAARDAAADTSTDADARPDATADTAAADTSPPVPLADAPGIAVWLAEVGWRGRAAADLRVEVSVGDQAAFSLGGSPPIPAFHRVPAPGDGGGPELVSAGTWRLEPGAVEALDPGASLLTWQPGVDSVALTLRAWNGDQALAALPLVIERGVGEAFRVVTADDAELHLAIRARAGVAGLTPGTTAGLLRGGGWSGPLAATWRRYLTEAVGDAPLDLKLYHGARKYLLRPGCGSDEACAEGGADYPCVETCACSCEAEGECDCDFSTLEADMRERVRSRIASAVPEDLPALRERARVHYVFKRSLGGTSSCEEHGELDVSAATYGAFFRAATAAAHRVNSELGFRAIDVLSPQNESNHPLQDGPHQGAAGHTRLGGDLGRSYRSLIEQASCNDDGCCDPDRYIADQPDAIGQLAHALVEARGYEQAALAAGSDAALIPRVAISLYLDDDQVDPLVTDDDGQPPPVVTPPARFFARLRDRLEQVLGATPERDRWASELIYVDTYPGSWGEPWYQPGDHVVHHMDPVTQRIVRVDPVLAADAVFARASKAIDAYVAVFGGERPEYALGEVGWSTFDGDEAAQARFVRRFFERGAAHQAQDPRWIGFLWFKDADRGRFVQPTWVSTWDPFSEQEIACEAWLLSRILCMAEVFTRMEQVWGLLRLEEDGTYAPKPGWDAFVQGVTRFVADAP